MKDSGKTSPKKILILGAAGQLGSAMARCMASAHRVVSLTHKDVDICQRSKLREALAAHRPDFVANCAAWTDVDGCEKDVERAYTVNAIAAGDIAEEAREFGAKMVHISTDYIFDGFKDTPYTEDDDPDPLSIYGKSKLEAEILVRKAQPGALIVRSSWLFGNGRSNFVLRLFQSVIAGPEVRVVNDQRGTPTFAKDLAGAIQSLLERGCTGTVHVSNTGECTWYEYACEIVKTLQIKSCRIVPVSSDQMKRAAPRPAYSVLDNGRCEKLTGNRLRPWQKALAEFLAGLNTNLNPADVWS